MLEQVEDIACPLVGKDLVLGFLARLVDNLGNNNVIVARCSFEEGFSILGLDL